MTVSLDKVRQIPAHHYTVATDRTLRVIVIHDMEYPEGNSGAEWCANYFAKPDAPRASAHYYVDSDSIVQGVAVKYVAWAAPGCNRDGIQIEMAGYARQNRTQWLDSASTAELSLAAQLVAALTKRYGIPIVQLSASDLLAGRAGITGHKTVNDAYHRSDHWDPGPNFPWDWFIAKVKAERAILDGTPKPKPKPQGEPPSALRPVLRLGSVSDSVYRLQVGLLRVFPAYAGPIKAHGGPIRTFGPATESVLREFQRRSKIPVTGVTDTATWRELAKYGIKP